MTPLLATDLRAGYGGTEILHGLDMRVDAGEVVVVLGPNGAGKTTLLLALAGAISSTGSIELLGAPALRGVQHRARRGLAFLPEDRGVVRALTVEENLRLARVAPDAAYDLAPELHALADRKAGSLSGGEQQILALTRAIANKPRLLLADELSFGLAPIIVQRMLRLVREAAQLGSAVLLVEQFARQALEVADRAYLLQRGRVALDGRAANLLRDIDAVEHAYMGVPPVP